MAKEFSLNPRKWVNQFMHKTPWDVAEAAQPFSDTTLVSSNVYQAAFEFPVPVYKKGFTFKFTVPVTNTGAAFIRLPGLSGNLSLLKNTTVLDASDLVVGRVYTGVYNGSSVQVDVPLTSVPSEWLTAEVDLSDADILSIGSGPITLLPVPAADQYYEYEMRIEYTYGTAPYTLNDLIVIGGTTSYQGVFINPDMIVAGVVNTATVIKNMLPQNTGSGVTLPEKVMVNYLELGEGVMITTWNGTDPINGDGTLKFFIKYKLHTFGVQ